MQRLRCCVFTLNNYVDADEDRLRACERTSYLCYGREVAPRTGTKHLQGYMEFKKQVAFLRLRAEFPGFHLEPRRGTAQQAIDYCKKGGDYHEQGEPKHQGQRYDLDACRDAALYDGMRAVSGVYNAQAIKTAEKFLEYNEEPRNWITTVIWYYGPTGIGKSKRARDKAGAAGFKTEEVYIKNVGDRWWPGYDAHPCVIIDDWRDTWWPFTYTLAVFDRYELRIELKGSHRQFKPKIIYVTTNKHPQTCYGDESIEQLLRRITTIRHMQ